MMSEPHQGLHAPTEREPETVEDLIVPEVDAEAVQAGTQTTGSSSTGSGAGKATFEEF